MRHQASRITLCLAILIALAACPAFAKKKSAKVRLTELEARVAAIEATGGQVGPQGPPGPAGTPGVALFARVDETGAVLSSSPGVTATKPIPVLSGLYLVTFSGRDLTNCAAVASPESGYASVLVAYTNSASIDVTISDGGLTTFSLVVACP